MRKLGYIGKLLVGVTAITLSCCTNTKENCFCEDYEVIEDPKPVRKLTAERILAGDTLLDMGRIFCIGDKLLDANVQNKEAIFTVYSNQGKRISSFGKVGRAQNEFSQGIVLTQQVEDGKIWVNDVNKAKLIRVDFKASLDSSLCMVDKEIITAGRVINAFCVNDSTILYEQETKDNYRIHLFNTKQNRILKRYDLYTPSRDAFGTYYSHLLLHPDKNRLAGVMTTLNQVNFLSVKDGKKKALSLYQKAILETDDEKKTQFYCGVTSTADNVYALYMNQSQEDSFSKPKPMEIHVFGWDGTFKGVLVADEYITRIAVDTQGRYLYGLDLDNNVYKYKLK